ncbi:hypothetical protein Mboo_0903 [Methanoregula boonei 6A8]|jgi:flavodoxin|uniref:Flavodoxin-like domain-containing protein n=1 Tax=Methanoregula boonei (strain DSM 21154 / JCM 14090 / 6A8) TaxID=456442 RepID=A7I6R0_METB6|nr:NAD(P)H-dependent oxidoreductase [Methanoregula boonei]ABS55421.1 hypothetical protein Mboo_0903 [Methanoregula boonei 6A8]
MTALVAYYSRKGRTEKVAHAIAENLGAELVRITPPGQVNLAIGVMEAMMVMKSAIKSCRTDLTGIDTLVIVTPVWAGKIPPFVSMYLYQVSPGEGKKFAVFTERGRHGSDHPIRLVRHVLEGKGMNFVASGVTIESDVDSGEYLSLVRKFTREVLGQ